MIKFSHPGAILNEEYLKPAKLKAADLARAAGLSRGRVSEILRGKRDITAEIAYRIEGATGISATLWLGLQNDYDLKKLKRAKAKSIRAQIKPLRWQESATL
jgi:addiction module HigA family antidote